MLRVTVLSCLGGFFGLVLAMPATAVLVTNGSQLPETLSAPADDPGWANVGRYATASSVYLGDRWILTASHLGVQGGVELEGQVYDIDPNSRVAFVNDGPNLPRDPDLVMIRLLEDPGLPPIQISSTPPTAGQEVVVIGNGLDAEPDLTYWDVTQRGTTWTWTESSPPGDYSGYPALTTSVKRWGTNLLEDEEPFNREFDDDIVTPLTNQTTSTVTILTEFDAVDGANSDIDVTTADGAAFTAYESQALLLDSGGGMFSKVDGGSWQLSGIVLSVEGHRQQPDVVRYGIYGGLTYYADVATYASQIEEQFLFGDFDLDGQISANDLDLLAVAMNSDEYDAAFDLDRDGQIGIGDRSRWIDTVGGSYFGDSNLDGEFGTADLVQVLQGGLYEDAVSGNATWETGDWDGNLEFDTRDLVIALQAGGFEAGPRVNAAVAAQSVPEPSSSSCLLLAVLAWWTRRCRTRSI